MKKYLILSIIFLALFFTDKQSYAATDLSCVGKNNGDKCTLTNLVDGSYNGICVAGSCQSIITSLSDQGTAASKKVYIDINNAKEGNVSTAFVNPIGFTSVSGVVGALLNNLKGLIAWIAVLFIVIGGTMYILSAGNEKMITRAKATITSAVIGLAIALAAPTFLKEIKNILGGGTGVNADEMVNNALTIKDIVMRTLNLLLSVVGIVAIISLVIGGAFYLTAYGDEDRAKKGKTIITNSLIGIVVVMAALVIVSQIGSLLKVQ